MREQIKIAITKQLDMQPEDIRDDALIVDDLGATSLDAVELLMTLEDQFGISIPDEDVMELKTVIDIEGYIENKQENEAR